MAFDEHTAGRVRDALRGIRHVSEKKMFGGLAFMLNGNMVCGIRDRELMARVGASGYAEALKLPGARPMDFTGRPLNGYVYVSAQGIADDDALQAWVGRCVEFVGALPAK
jgi:TfoX/Sxy family transcriptional regulator of competence genes